MIEAEGEGAEEKLGVEVLAVAEGVGVLRLVDLGRPRKPDEKPGRDSFADGFCFGAAGADGSTSFEGALVTTGAFSGVPSAASSSCDSALAPASVAASSFSISSISACVARLRPEDGVGGGLGAWSGVEDAGRGTLRGPAKAWVSIGSRVPVGKELTDDLLSILFDEVPHVRRRLGLLGRWQALDLLLGLGPRTEFLANVEDR